MADATADQSFSTNIDEQYILKVDVIGALPSLTVSIGETIGTDDVLASQPLTTIDSYQFDFVATSLTSWIRFQQTENDGDAYIDNVSVMSAGHIPGQRTVYIEVGTETDTDGLASQTVLDAAREMITTDPDTGQDRQPLGLTDQMLWVESIYRSGFHVTISNLDVDAAYVAACKDAIATAIEGYFRGLRPYIDGLDPPALKNDTITSMSLSRVVMDVVEFYSGTVDEIDFGINLGQDLSSYTLNEGETAKTASIVYE